MPILVFDLTVKLNVTDEMNQKLQQSDEPAFMELEAAMTKQLGAEEVSIDNVAPRE